MTDPQLPADPPAGSSTDGDAPALPALMAEWIALFGRTQQVMAAAVATPGPSTMPADTGALASQVASFWTGQMAQWRQWLAPSDERADAWRESPVFDAARQLHGQYAAQMLRTIDMIEGVADRRRAQWRFAANALIEATDPAHFPLTNPDVIERTLDSNGDTLAAGLKHLFDDVARGQLTHTKAGAFELGRNLATTPGKVVKRTPLYELIQYAPATAEVLAVPLVIFPPWINRYYILDLTPQKSFIRWCVDHGISVFVVSWKSADASMADVIWDDYVAAQIEAVDIVRELLDVPAVHTIGYCVAGTTLAATLAHLAARGEAARIASATFLTAQVDFAQAGDLLHFVSDDLMALIGTLSPEGYLDGRYMAATFNLLRGRDLIWRYVTNNYLLGHDYTAFDLLHWNGDVTNLPAKWHLAYLADLYRDNRLVQPGSLSVLGTPLDLTSVTTPAYVQAGREDHIAPPGSVWEITRHFRGAMRFVLAGSGHIAGVVNPPAAGKYQYWTNDGAAETLDAFVAGATETKGSWWPDWLRWLEGQGPERIVATGARLPGGGSLPAIEDAPGRYVRTR